MVAPHLVPGDREIIFRALVNERLRRMIMFHSDPHPSRSLCKTGQVDHPG